MMQLAIVGEPPALLIPVPELPLMMQLVIVGEEKRQAIPMPQLVIVKPSTTDAEVSPLPKYRP